MTKNWIGIYAEKIFKAPNAPLLAKEAVFRCLKFLQTCGQSHPLSFILRPYATHKYARLLPGFLLVSGVFWFSSPFPLVANAGGTPTLNLNAEADVSIDTQVSTQLPVSNFVLTQGFSTFHSGYDLAVPVGSPVKPVMTGIVIQAEKNWFGYGNMILIDHHNGYQSRYGHLSQILVSPGQPVNLNTIIGLSGSTGRSTGPHLHLEIIQDQKVVNPKIVLGF